MYMFVWQGTYDLDLIFMVLWSMLSLHDTQNKRNVTHSYNKLSISIQSLAGENLIFLT